MKTKKIIQLLQRYFNGESTLLEEQSLKDYFLSENIAEELKEYSGYFIGISELTDEGPDTKLENKLMDYILQNEAAVKTNKHRLWQTIAGAAASVLIGMGILFYFQNKKKPFEETFDNPEAAYAYAAQTLEYISEKYNKGLLALSDFEKIESATKPLQKNIDKINKYMELVENMDDN
ncbi:MAG: hypothetical protein M0Q41_12775 [Bacteroidales bacterium]|nr:hypothetical protein [Bacteroidales bacterium]